MNAVELLERARTANLTVEAEGEGLLLRAPVPPPDDLLEDIATYKPTLLAYLRAERERAAAVDDAWDRIAYTYQRYGSPQGWLTDQVRQAEANVDHWWLKARKNPAHNARCIEAIETWRGVALAFIATANANEAAEKWW